MSYWSTWDFYKPFIVWFSFNEKRNALALPDLGLFLLVLVIADSFLKTDGKDLCYSCRYGTTIKKVRNSQNPVEQKKTMVNTFPVGVQPTVNTLPPAVRNIFLLGFLGFSWRFLSARKKLWSSSVGCALSLCFPLIQCLYLMGIRGGESGSGVNISFTKNCLG